VVRDATIGDAEAIARVRTRSWQEAYRHLFTPDELAGISADDSVQWWRDAIARGFLILVAEHDGAVQGFASGGLSRDEDAPGVGELMMIYVEPEAWGKGLGQALIAELESRLREQSYEEALLWVAEDNPRTRRFYELAGWEPDGTQRPVEFLGREISEVRYRKSL
jgi:GNAT superfamily N-acetyltransferase